MNGFTLLFLAFPLLAFAGPSPSLSERVDSFVDAYFLAEGQLRYFDRELAKNPKENFLARSAAYRDLVALRILLDQESRELGQQWQSLGENDAERKVLLTKIESLGVAERFAVHELLREAREKKRGLPLFYSTLREELTARRAASRQIGERIEAARGNSALAARVRGIAATLDFSAAAAPAPLKIQPSAGPGGTINGQNFPVNTWALTFDDGPHPKYTPAIFAHLQAAKKKASFLWLVECLEPNTELAAKAKAFGFPTNNHSWTHQNLDKAAPEVRQKEIADATTKETEIYGEKPRFFRLPYGAGLSNQKVRQLIADNGMIHVFWNVDSLDWQDKDPASILARVKKLMAAEKRGIILMHDIHPQTVEAVKLLLDSAAPTQRWVVLPAIVDELNQRLP